MFAGMTVSRSVGVGRNSLTREETVNIALRVEFLLKTESGYHRDAEVT